MISIIIKLKNNASDLKITILFTSNLKRTF